MAMKLGSMYTIITKITNKKGTYETRDFRARIN